MIENEILKELWQVRETYAAKFNYDLKAIYRDLKERERQGEKQLISFAGEEPDESAMDPQLITAVPNTVSPPTRP